MSSEVVEEVKERVLSLFESGSRYQVEKLVTIVAYVVIVIGTGVWVSMGDSENELGASHGFERVAPLNQKLFFLENDSGDDWTNVRVVLNKNYLYKTDTVPAGERLVLRPENFSYYYFIPRPWGRNDWELLSDEEKPPDEAPNDVTPRLVQVRATEGRLDVNLASPGEGAVE